MTLSTSPAYHPLSILLHWLVALLAGACGVSALLLGWGGSGLSRAALLGAHVVTGQLLFLLNLLRLTVFSRFGTPAVDGCDAQQQLVARCLHALLYGAVGFLACTGTLLMLAYAAGNVWLGWQVPLLLAPSALALMRELHGMASMIFVALCLLHALYAVALHCFARTGTLARMQPEQEALAYLLAPVEDDAGVRLDQPETARR
ncbi:cytochrome b/b6 domain-containing protein [Chitinilyticum litopenaei]|uniref:cytochrome b/b6 domain-containing protein n=1 Tax=Chitinilyticum litopenaei TaxID=1121276 RepID=UPI0003FBF552|nr:cytochrome b/b6 domain-containing protein [Chitinilyticum litopenaei]